MPVHWTRKGRDRARTENQKKAVVKIVRLTAPGAAELAQAAGLAGVSEAEYVRDVLREHFAHDVGKKKRTA